MRPMRENSSPMAELLPIMPPHGDSSSWGASAGWLWRTSSIMAWEQRVTISCVACFLRGGVQKIRLSSEDLKNGRKCSDKLKYILGISIVRACKVESRTGTPAVRRLGHGYRPQHL